MSLSKAEPNFMEHLKPLLPAGGDASELEAAAQALAGKGAGANRFTEGLLWLVLQEALDFVGQGVLLLDLMQEGAMGLLQAMEHPGADPIERGRWHVRQAMAQTLSLINI